jgi:hypothetical protein
VIAIVVAAVSLARADRADWVGSAACGACHPDQYAAWQQTRHARAADALGAKPRGRCLGCHGTGEAPAGANVALEVGCEACHGAGADYAADDLMRDRPLALALGMRDLSKDPAAICASCHRGTGTKLTEPELAITAETVH